MSEDTENQFIHAPTTEKHPSNDIFSPSELNYLSAHHSTFKTLYEFTKDFD